MVDRELGFQAGEVNGLPLYLLPGLLSVDEPEVKAYDIAAHLDRAELRFRYLYELLPAGVMSRFIVRTHSLSEDLHRWKRGVVLGWGNARALVMAESLRNPRVDIAITGGTAAERQELAGVVRANMEVIHRGLPDGLRGKEELDLTLPGAQYKSMEDLEALEKASLPVQVITSSGPQSLPVTPQLEQVQPAEARLDTAPRLKVFISYAHANYKAWESFKAHLDILKNNNQVDWWFDGKIRNGSEWDDAIRKELKEADIVILLLSNGFFASKYIQGVELLEARRRQQMGEAEILPVLLEPCAEFGDHPWLKKLQTVPSVNGQLRPITTFNPRVNGWHQVDQALRKMIAEVAKQRREEIRLRPGRLGVDSAEPHPKAMRLTDLKMSKFAPFADGVIKFAEVERNEGLAEVHLLTGENGTGKTRVLAALMAALGNQGPLLDRVRQDAGTELVVRAGATEWRFEDGNVVSGFKVLMDLFGTIATPFAMAGSGIALLDDTVLSVGAALKPARAVDYLSLTGPVGGGGIMQRLFNLRMEVALERDSNGDVTTGRMARCLNALEGAIAEITGQEFSLKAELGREPRLTARWREAPMFFSELPDGLRSLLNWLAGWVVLQAQNFESSDDPLKEPVILLLDEPENHLHPAWQRRVLPAVQRLFPNAQMFVVTHSPFVVSSLNVGWIHKFTRGEDGKVLVEPPQAASRGDSYMTAVQEVLGLLEWFDPETEDELAKFDGLLEAAYSQNGSSEQAMRAKAAELMTRSQEVTNIVGGLVHQFDLNREAKTSR